MKLASLLQPVAIISFSNCFSLQLIEVKMKRQLSAPSYIPPSSPEVLLRSTVWLEGMDEEIIDYITSLAEERVFDSGDTIVRQGEKTDGMYLIISGLVKVSNFFFESVFFDVSNLSRDSTKFSHKFNLIIYSTYLSEINTLNK